MKSKLLALGVTIPFAANAATEVSLQNFQGVTTGSPIVDNSGAAIDPADTSWAVGTFAPEFIADTLPGLNIDTDDQQVIDAFLRTGEDQTFTNNGVFNRTVSTDSGNALEGAPIYAMITFTPAAGGTEVLLFDIGRDFPVQDGAGNAVVDLGRLLNPDDVAFGWTEFVDVTPASLPGPLQKPEFYNGITFNTAIPEPSTGLLSLIAGLGLLARRRR